MPIADLGASVLGLYDDGRFPGRCLLVLKEHREHWEDLQAPVLNSFVADSQRAMRAIRAVTGSSRVNLAVLGNTDAHVHSHLVPRFPDLELLPGKSPWNDPRPLFPLPPGEAERLIEGLAAAVAAPPAP
jgi:diadenosine tetraphosphate (Ap4A) HIT family hydrolase